MRVIGRARSAVLALAVSACLAPTVAAGPASASTFPEEFTDTLVAGALGAPTAVEQLPDGRFLVTSQDGKLLLVEDGTVTTALDLAAASRICAGGDGLLGVAVDPDFAANAHVFLFYTARTNGSCALNGANAGGAKNRVSRFTMNGATLDLGSELVLLDNMPDWGGTHSGGAVNVANDGTLFVGVGDGGAGRPENAAADLSLPNGKILRINRDGTIPAGNPHGTTVCRNTWGPPGASKVCGEIYADGLRNPFRLAFDDAAPGVRFRINDVGQATWEEVDEGIAGAHYGWPCREGPVATGSGAQCNAPTTDPVLFYNHDTGCDVVTAGAFVPPGTWQGYDGAYLFVDFGCGELFVAQSGETGAPATVLATGMQLTTDMRFFASAGRRALFYTSMGNGGELRRVDGPLPSSPPGTIPGTKFTAEQPSRVLDTRSGIGVAAGKPAPGSTITVKVTGGDIPADARAVALNLTATSADGPGFVTAWATGGAFPPTSSLNVTDIGETAANAVVVPVGQGGSISLYTRGGADLVADVTGSFTDAGATTDGRFVTAAAPTRALDTRNGTGGKAGAFVAGDQFDLVVTGTAAGVPDDATAVAVTVTYTNVGEAGYLTLWPAGAPRPVASTSNPNGPGDIRSNLALVPVGADGEISIYSYRRADVVVDVVGWFTTRSESAGLFTVVVPQRVADSRLPGAPFPRIGAGVTAAMELTDLAPGPSTAVLYNLTTTNTVEGGFVTAFPAYTARPTASSVNWSAPEQSRAALTISALSSANVVALFAMTPVDAVVDVAGWFEE